MIRVESKIGKGTTFHLYFPKLAEPAFEKPKDDDQKIPLGHESILFVDDEAVLTVLVNRLLEPLGYRVTTFTDPLEALENFRGHPETYDLVITDMTMPRMTGNVLARKLKAARPDIPVIICTGFSERISENQVKSTDACTLLLKPFGRKELAEQIRRVLDKL